MNIDPKLWDDAVLQMRKSIAVYELLHAHAAGETDLSEDQLANVVTGVAAGARDTLHRMRGAGGG